MLFPIVGRGIFDAPLRREAYKRHVWEAVPYGAGFFVAMYSLLQYNIVR